MADGWSGQGSFALVIWRKPSTGGRPAPYRNGTPMRVRGDPRHRKRGSYAREVDDELAAIASGARLTLLKSNT